MFVEGLSIVYLSEDYSASFIPKAISAFRCWCMIRPNLFHFTQKLYGGKAYRNEAVFSNIVSWKYSIDFEFQMKFMPDHTQLLIVGNE